ncbi:MAG: hypothetical protein F6K17_28825 [Okeania sp. SIO3C4]|nr:hypothetical protein [Okeania sp. SIO3C4]
MLKKSDGDDREQRTGNREQFRLSATANFFDTQQKNISAKRQKAGGRRQKGRKVILQAFEAFFTG